MSKHQQPHARRMFTLGVGNRF